MNSTNKFLLIQLKEKKACIRRLKCSTTVANVVTMRIGPTNALARLTKKKIQKKFFFGLSQPLLRLAHRKKIEDIRRMGTLHERIRATDVENSDDHHRFWGH